MNPVIHTIQLTGWRDGVTESIPTGIATRGANTELQVSTPSAATASVIPLMLNTHGVRSSIVWPFCELQMALILNSTELDEVFFQVMQTNSLHLAYSCVLQMW